MPKEKFQNLIIRKQYRYKNQGFTKKENVGFDTETYQGYAKLICDSDGRYQCITNFDDVLKFLTFSNYRNKFNWFYNVRFDFEALIKYLDYGQLINLYSDKFLKLDNFYLQYIPKKFFMITDENNHRYRFYDMYNFLDTSLNSAAKKFLDMEKMAGVDSAKLNVDKKYWEEYKEKIVLYCITDALITKKLADFFWGVVYKNMQYYPKRPFSKGRISEEYFLDRCYFPSINEIPLKVLEFAYNAYSGGRFELLQKGYFEKVYSYDIKSAYPAQIAELIDYTKGKWLKTDKFHPDAYSGFYLCSVSSLEVYFSPFLKKVGELNVYPNFSQKIYLAKREYEFIEANFPNASLNVLSGYEFWEKERLFPFKTEIERLYAWKEKEPDETLKYCVKIFLNSLYGKTIQITDNKTGKLFNPIYAAEITESARIKILELGLQKPESIIMFSTDAVHSTDPLKVKSNPQLGDFAKDFSGEGVYIMSDVYNLWNDKKQKSRIRGFSVSIEKDYTSEDILLKDILQEMNNTIYNYTTTRVYHLGECLLHKNKRKLSDMNIFEKVEKSIDINGDKKRNWNADFKSGKEVFKKVITSEPLFL